jgi:hypothetical protein
MDFPAATRGRTAVAHYSDDGHSSGADRETTLADLIADLIIWAALREIDWEEALERAQNYAAIGDPCQTCGTEVPSACLHCPGCANGALEPR